jgi:hypothetical protein
MTCLPRLTRRVARVVYRGSVVGFTLTVLSIALLDELIEIGSLARDKVARPIHRSRSRRK